MNIFERELAGKLISTDDPEYEKILEIILDTMDLCRELNSGVHTKEENLEYLSRIIERMLTSQCFSCLHSMLTTERTSALGKAL